MIDKKEGQNYVVCTGVGGKLYSLISCWFFGPLLHRLTNA